MSSIMGQTPSKPTKQWADSPYKLLQTPRARNGDHNLKNEHPASAAATEMCLVHNTLIRGLNSLWLQAPNITSPTDIHDFVINAFSWSKTIHIHHENEETFFFGWLEDDIGVPHGTVMGDNVKQHHAFRQGLKAFDDYVDGIRYGKEGFRWDGMKFRQLLDGFCQGEEGLYKHLGEEIVTFERLEEYGDKIDWKRWNARTNKKAVGDADFEFEIPWAVCNADFTYEDGIHKSTWPPYPWYVGLMIRWIGIPKHKGAWRFSCCDSNGRPKDLPFV